MSLISLARLKLTEVAASPSMAKSLYCIAATLSRTIVCSEVMPQVEFSIRISEPK